MDPILLFKGKGRVSADEKQQYSKGVHVIFTPKAVINGSAMQLYVKRFLEKVNDFG